MKICFPFVGNVVGGSHISTITLIEELKKRNIEPVIVLHQQHGLLANYLDQRNLSYILAPPVPITTAESLIKQIIAMGQAARPLAQFLKNENIDIVHANDLRMNYTWLPATKLAGKKFVWHQRSASSSKRIGFLSLFTHSFITISSYCKSVLDKSARKRASVIYNPVSISQDEMQKDDNYYDFKAKLNIPADAKIIGFIGNTTPQKNPLAFIKLAHEIGKLNSNAYFVMIGEIRDEYGQKAKRWITKLQLSERCFMIGPRFPIAHYLTDFDVLIAPGVNEGLGRTLIEAMACKVPIVAADDGGHREIIVHNKNGFLVKPNDTESYCEIICKILDGSIRKDVIIEYAYKDAAARFSAKTHADAIVKTYQSLLLKS